MKKFLLIIALVSPILVGAQTLNTDSLMNEMMVGLDHEKWDDVIACFRQFSEVNPESAEVFYWVKAYDKTALSDTLLLGLAKSYYEKGNYSKALELSRTFYKNSKNPSVNKLLELADLLTNLGDIRFTQNVYSQVIIIDPNNLSANLFLGNYLYLRAERERKRVCSIYEQKNKPTRMQYAEYREKLKELYTASYMQAREHLQRAYRKLSSSELKATISHIDEIKKDIL